MKVLVLSDSHISPVCPNVEEWKALGVWCVQEKPDYIIHLGDVANLDSLAWKIAARGPFTTDAELSCVLEHLKAFESVIKAEQLKNRKDKKKMYKPKRVLCLGNHDIRNNFTGIADLFRARGWDVHDYLSPFIIDDIAFCHCMMRGLTDQPCTSAQELLENWHSTIVVGHGHARDYSESFNIVSGEKIFAIKCPVFNSDDTGWAAQTRNKWSRGFTVIDTDTKEFVWKDIECLHKLLT